MPESQGIFKFNCPTHTCASRINK